MRLAPEIVTSVSSPLQAPQIALPAGLPGSLRITFAPGKRGLSANGKVQHQRDLQLDLQALVGSSNGTSVLVGFTQAREMEEKIGVPLRILEQSAEDVGMTYLHFEIEDVQAPRQAGDKKAALTLSREMAARVQAGETVTVYCRGGLGRSGMMAAVVLTQLGVSPDQAIADVKLARPGAVETDEQEEFVRWAAAASRGCQEQIRN